jgi:hypothetical protein
MSRQFLALSCLVTVGVASALGAAACSSSSSHGVAKDGGGEEPSSDLDAGDEVCTAYVSDADLSDAAPSVSFSGDILPVFQNSCGIAGSTCHGAADIEKTQQRPFLGLHDGGTDASAVVTGIVGVPSNEDPAMNIVAPNDVTHSYLLHKIDGDECTLAAACADAAVANPAFAGCGLTMPYSSPQLDPATRDTIRRWVAQGAKNN